VVDLSLDRPGEHLHVRAVTDKGICIADAWYDGPLLLTPDAIHSDWPPYSVAALDIEHLKAIFDLRPDVALLGTGATHEQLPRELLVEVYRLGAGGLEVMSTDAACRTFNVLAGDGRKVVAGLLPMQLPRQ
jgi:uncharacterized protein